MTFVMILLGALHILGAAAIFGGWLANFKTPTVNIWQWAGAWVQLLTGLAMVGIAEMQGFEVDRAKIAVKLLIGIAVVIAAFIGRRKLKAGQEVSTGIAHATGGLAFINILVATLWN